MAFTKNNLFIFWCDFYGFIIVDIYLALVQYVILEISLLTMASRVFKILI